MTPGACGETADGMSEAKIQRDHRADARRAVPVRPGPPGLYPEEERQAPAARIAVWSDKLVGEVVRLLLEAYYEPGSLTGRTGSGKGEAVIPRCGRYAKTWTGTIWFIEGDISDCFGSLDHEILSGYWRRKSAINGFSG